MRVSLLSAELAPIAKVGGLADVVRELPLALKSLGVDVRVSIPFHQSIDRSRLDYRQIDEVTVRHATGSHVGKIYHAVMDGLDVYLIDGDSIAAVKGIYSNPEADGNKYAFFSLAALEASRSADWKPDILHANDWHSSPAVVWLNRNRAIEPFWSSTASLLTVHNLPYMGAGTSEGLANYGIGPVSHPRLPKWAENIPLPMGLVTADWISTVSPTYANEIQTPRFGHGLEELLSTRKDHLVGILNGIDLSNWNPKTDEALEENFDKYHLLLRLKGRASLLASQGLRTDSTIPLLAIITRLDSQKGVDLSLEALAFLREEPWHLMILGTGDPELEELIRKFETIFFPRVRTIFRFDAQLARRIYASADMMLIPSRYEPCGLTQMIAMRYGCVPIVSATGGLKDTVLDLRTNSKGTGFVHTPSNGLAHAEAIRDAFSIFRVERRWRRLQRRVMSKDFSWDASARKYLQLYEEAVEEVRNEAGRAK